MHDKSVRTKYNLSISIVKINSSLRKTNLNFRGRHKNITEVKPLCQHTQKKVVCCRVNINDVDV